MCVWAHARGSPPAYYRFKASIVSHSPIRIARGRTSRSILGQIIGIYLGTGIPNKIATRFLIGLAHCLSFLPWRAPSLHIMWLIVNCTSTSFKL